MWTRSTLSDFAKIHMVVNPLSLYRSKRDTGSAVTPILKIHNLMPIFSRKQMALDLQWDKFFPAVGLETFSSNGRRSPMIAVFAHQAEQIQDL